jgi:proteic killer suppression protein
LRKGNRSLIRSFSHKGLRQLFESGSHKGIEPSLKGRLTIQLDALDAASDVRDMGLPGFDLHELRGKRKGVWSVTVRANWRLTFRFENGDASAVDLEDYH